VNLASLRSRGRHRALLANLTGDSRPDRASLVRLGGGARSRGGRDRVLVVAPDRSSVRHDACRGRGVRVRRIALPDGDQVAYARKCNACSLSESVQWYNGQRQQLTGDGDGHGGQEGRGELHVVDVEVDRLPWWWGYGCCVVLCWMDGKRCEEEKRGREEERREEAGFVYALEP
jgi:hypothetical protein